MNHRFGDRLCAKMGQSTQMTVVAADWVCQNDGKKGDVYGFDGSKPFKGTKR